MTTEEFSDLDKAEKDYYNGQGTDYTGYVSRLGKILRAKRKVRGISRKEIVEDLKLKSVQSIANIEQGRALVPLKHIPYYMKKLDVAVSLFIQDRQEYMRYRVLNSLLDAGVSPEEIDEQMSYEGAN